MTEDNEDLAIHIEDVSRWHPPPGQTGHGVLLHTTRGDIHILVHNSADPEHRTTKAILYVWGARGGFDGPANGIYGRLAEDLKDEITSIRIDYRLPNVMTECVLDTMAGLSFLSATGHTDVALVGHSFGGAVVIATAPFSPMVKAVAALSSQIIRRVKRRRGISLAHCCSFTAAPIRVCRRAAPSRSTIGPTNRRKWS